MIKGTTEWYKQKGKELETITFEMVCLRMNILREKIRSFPRPILITSGPLEWTEILEHPIESGCKGEKMAKKEHPFKKFIK